MASVLVFCVPRALMSICLDPTHLVTCLLINFPQLFSLVTLIICSLYNLLVFAVPCGFVTLCLMSSVSSLVQPCPALPCLLASQLVFPLRGSFCLFVLFLLNKLVAHNLHLSLRSLPFTSTLTLNLFEPNIPTNLSEANLFEFSLNYFLLNCLSNLVFNTKDYFDFNCEISTSLLM